MALRILGLLLLALTAQVQAIQDEFLIGVGDLLRVEVYNEPDLFLRTRVGESEHIKMPLIGNVKATDKTPLQLSEEIETGLFDGYLVSPTVTVIIEKFRPFYIKGAVKSAGAYAFEPDLTVEQAIAIAGGLKDRASKNKWFIMRGKQKKRIAASKDSKLHPGDIITIDESLF